MFLLFPVSKNTKKKNQRKKKSLVKIVRSLQTEKAPLVGARVSKKGMYTLSEVKQFGKDLIRKALINGGTFLGAEVGGAVGGVPGSLAGSTLGKTLGAKVSRLIGTGRYYNAEGFTGLKGGRDRISDIKNTIIQSNPVPTFSSGGERGVIIAHSEFLRNISGSVNFAISKIPINPGLDTCFPWLSQVARNFTEYEMLGLVFEYKPTSGNIAAASPALGVVMLSTNYNVHEPAFGTKTDMASAQFAVDTVPCDEVMHPVECAKRSNIMENYLIRSGDVESDLAFYDMGNFYIATEGMQSVYVVGELWVTYHVRLGRPVISHLPGEMNMTRCVWDTMSVNSTHQDMTSVTERPGSNIHLTHYFEPYGYNYFALPAVSSAYLVIVKGHYSASGTPTPTTRMSIYASSTNAAVSGPTGKVWEPFQLWDDYTPSATAPRTQIRGCEFDDSYWSSSPYEDVCACILEVNASLAPSESEADNIKRSFAVFPACKSDATFISGIVDLWVLSIPYFWRFPESSVTSHISDRLQELENIVRTLTLNPSRDVVSLNPKTVKTKLV